MRARVWRMTADLLDSGMELNRALALVSDIEAARSRRLRMILANLRSALRTDSFAEAVLEIVPEAEALLFSRFGQASDASIFAAAARMTSVDERVARAIRQALLWPVFLLILVFMLFWLLGVRLFPTLATLAPISEWPPSSRLVAMTSIWVADHGVLVIAGIIGTIGLYKWAERHHAGRGRVWLDRFPPWSLYRLRTGASFAFVLIENARVGHEITRAWLLRLADTLPPYSRSRILAIAARADQTDIGRAAVDAGHNWPDPELNAVLRAYAGQADWVPRYARYADAWLERLQERVEAAVVIVRLGLMVVAAMILGGAAQVIVNLTSLVS